MSAMNTTSTPAANASSPAGLQSRGASSRSAHYHHRTVNKLPSLVDQRWPHPDRRAPPPPLTTPTFKNAVATSNCNSDQAEARTSAPASIDVLQAAANIATVPVAAASASASSPSSSSPDDDHHHHHSISNNNNDNINTATTITITANHDDSSLTALPSMSLKPAPLLTSPSSYSSLVSPSGGLAPSNRSRFPFLFRPRPFSLSCLPLFLARFPRFARTARTGEKVWKGKGKEEEPAAAAPAAAAATATAAAAVEPVRLWTAGQLARAQRARLADAMAAEIARLNAEVRRLEAVVGVEPTERGRGRRCVGVRGGSGGVRESWVTVDDDGEWEEEEE